MSSRRASDELRFQGPELEPLLEQVRREVGEQARIVAANRVRRGGVGGFFAKEYYEIVVERDGAPTPNVVHLVEAEDVLDLRTPAPAPMSHVPTSVLDLVDETNLIERARNEIDLRDTRDPSPARPKVSTESHDFGAVLDRITAQNQAAAPVIERPAPAKPAPAVRPDPEPVVVREPAHEPARTIDPADRDVFAGSEATTIAPPATPFVAPRTLRDETPELIERPENMLAGLGVPAKLVPRGQHGNALRGALIESLAHLPTPFALPDARGVVVAVVGVGSRAVALARTLAAERGLDPDNVVLATQSELPPGIPSWLQISEPGHAEERRRSWRRRDHPTFVAVSVPSATSGGAWAREMLDHLEPTQVWGIVNAAWKPDDIDAWSDRLGGVDALALDQLDETVSPAAVLALDIPVGRIDGEPATPLRWAELLLERMADR